MTRLKATHMSEDYIAQIKRTRQALETADKLSKEGNHFAALKTLLEDSYHAGALVDDKLTNEQLEEVYATHADGGCDCDDYPLGGMVEYYDMARDEEVMAEA